MNFHTSSLRSPALHQLADRDPQAFLEHVAAAGADAVAADVGVVDRRAEEARSTRPPRNTGYEHGDVEQLAGRLVRIVGDQHVARSTSESVGYSSRIAAAAARQRVDVAGRAGDGLGHHPAAPVEHRVGEVAGLAHDRAEGGPLQRLGLLVDRGDQALPQHLELDRVECRSSSAAASLAVLRVAAVMRAIRRLRPRLVQPGRMTAVVSRSSTIAGPVDRLRRRRARCAGTPACRPAPCARLEPHRPRCRWAAAPDAGPADRRAARPWSASATRREPPRDDLDRRRRGSSGRRRWRYSRVEALDTARRRRPATRRPRRARA